MTDDIVAFIRARLDEDESDAQDASSRSADWERAEKPPARWGHDEPAPEILSGGRLYMTFEEDKGAPLAVYHVLRHDPARVLRGVEAKRRLLDVLWFAGSVSEVHDENGILIAGGGDAVNGALSLLASEWSTHPEYRQEWQA